MYDPSWNNGGQSEDGSYDPVNEDVYTNDDLGGDDGWDEEDDD